jgi:DNA-binding NarL/FixJ family response regulator
MTREEAIDIRARSLCKQPVSLDELTEAMRVIAAPEKVRRELPPGVTTNQWGLSIGMCETLTTVVSKGGVREAAIELGIAPRSVRVQILRAKERMGTDNTLTT